MKDNRLAALLPKGLRPPDTDPGNASTATLCGVGKRSYPEAFCPRDPRLSHPSSPAHEQRRNPASNANLPSLESDLALQTEEASNQEGRHERQGRGNTLYAISLLLVGGCSSSLQHNEGRTGSAQPGQACDEQHLPTVRTQLDDRHRKGEALSIKLIAAYLCDFREEKGNGDLLASGNKESSLCTGGDGSLFDNARSTQGEIAITASAGERGATSNGLSFNPADIKRNGRVVYYNEDIRESVN